MTAAISRAVLITGCSSGIGRATAIRLAGGSDPVYATARRIESIADLEERGCRTLVLDVTDEDSMKRAVAEIESEHGAVGVLVNNAGYGHEGAVESVSIEQVRRQFETNVFGLTRLTQLVVPAMRDQGWGRIVNISSVGGRLTFPGGGVYHASKYAVEALSDALRFELRGFAIDVVVVEPGFIKTDFGVTSVRKINEIQGDGVYDDFNRAVASSVDSAFRGPMSRFAGEPDDAARVIARAVRSRRPRTRYRVTFGGRFMLVVRRLLPDRAFDLILRTQFPTPARPRE